MRIDWFTVIAQLERQGVTQRSQADLLGVSRGTIAYWKSGGEPKFHAGIVLLHLYNNHVTTEYLPLTAPTT